MAKQQWWVEEGQRDGRHIAQRSWDAWGRRCRQRDLERQEARERADGREP